MVLSYNPEVIILDQFFKGMIAKDIKYFKNLFVKLKNKYDKTIILLSNAIEDMFDFVDNVYVLSNGELKVMLDKNEFYTDEIYKYTYMPKIIEFTKYAQDEGHRILNYIRAIIIFFNTYDKKQQIYKNNWISKYINIYYI